jgi:hypothetical protein
MVVVDARGGEVFRRGWLANQQLSGYRQIEVWCSVFLTPGLHGTRVVLCRAWHCSRAGPELQASRDAGHGTRSKQQVGGLRLEGSGLVRFPGLVVWGCLMALESAGGVAGAAGVSRWRKATSL